MFWIDRRSKTFFATRSEDIAKKLMKTRVQRHQSKTVFVPLIRSFHFKPPSRLHSDGKFSYQSGLRAAAFSHHIAWVPKREKVSCSFFYTLPVSIRIWKKMFVPLTWERRDLCAAQSSEWINERREWSLRRHRAEGWVPAHKGVALLLWSSVALDSEVN